MQFLEDEKVDGMERGNCGVSPAAEDYLCIILLMYYWGNVRHTKKSLVYKLLLL